MMEDAVDVVYCPFCGYRTESEYQIMLHMETLHPEGDSPFVVKEDSSITGILSTISDTHNEDDNVQYGNCPIPSCGETLHLGELENHISLHDAEEMDADDDSERFSKRKRMVNGCESPFDTKIPRALRNLDSTRESSPATSMSDPQETAKAVWRDIMKMPEPSSKPHPSTSSSNVTRRRLGKAELGPHANEKQMPSWLVKLLASDGEIKTINRLDPDGKVRKVKVCENQASDIIPVVEQLLQQDALTEYAYTCNPCVKHVSKLKKEGGFCGYRNIQMMASYIIGAQSQGFEHFRGKLPSIFEIQDYIESAWDLGINSQGRIETGGIRGTRKYIGTPDAQAMLCSLGIACDAQAFKTAKGAEERADRLLFQAVERYFVGGTYDFEAKVRRTKLPPLYFQHPGHSMTIIGFEKKKDGTKNLLVFDPMFRDASNVTKYVGRDRPFSHKSAGDLLRAYRRDLTYLRKYNEFETLKLTPPTEAEH